MNRIEPYAISLPIVRIDPMPVRLFSDFRLALLNGKSAVAPRGRGNPSRAGWVR